MFELSVGDAIFYSAVVIAIGIGVIVLMERFLNNGDDKAHRVNRMCHVMQVSRSGYREPCHRTGCAQSGATAIPSGSTGSYLGWRHDIHPHPPWLVAPGGIAGPVLAPGDRLVDERTARLGIDIECARHGLNAASPPGRVGAPYRSSATLCGTEIS